MLHSLSSCLVLISNSVTFADDDIYGVKDIMQYVSPPLGPPDEDDMYAPVLQYRHNQMTSLVWSVMRLSYAIPEFSWCTVCRKWFRVRLSICHK